MTTDLIVNDVQVLTARDIRKRVNLLKEVMNEVMTEGVHYGTIPGCPKPSLFKPGAEKIATTFCITVTSDVDDLSTSDEKRFKVTCTAYASNGVKLGSSAGICSSREEKYQWRKPVCDGEFEETDADRKREKWISTKDGKGMKVKRVRTEPSDLENTILQMADKRGYVAVVRKVTAASDVFTQDIEDLPEEMRQDAPDASTSGKPTVSMPQGKQVKAYTDIISLAQGKVGDTFDVQGYGVSVKLRQVGKDKSDITDITIADLPKDPTAQVCISIWGKHDAGSGQLVKFNEVKIGEYKEKKTFLAKEIANG